MKESANGRVVLTSTKQKISITRIKKIALGEITPWSKGLTKDKDERIKRRAEKMRGRPGGF